MRRRQWLTFWRPLWRGGYGWVLLQTRVKNLNGLVSMRPVFFSITMTLDSFFLGALSDSLPATDSLADHPRWPFATVAVFLIPAALLCSVPRSGDPDRFWFLVSNCLLERSTARLALNSRSAYLRLVVSSLWADERNRVLERKVADRRATVEEVSEESLAALVARRLVTLPGCLFLAGV
jgi:hypothetical protein